MDLLDRLHRRLLDAAAAGHAGGDSPVVSVADIYQKLVPYRLVRADLEVMELAEYEHTLLRLLAGERRYAEVLDQEVTQELRKELSSPNPILGVYRDYANARVRLARGVGQSPSSPAPRIPSPPTAHPPTREAPPSDTPRGSRPASTERRCIRCERPLPGHVAAAYCPFCGSPQGPAPCARCGASLAEDWSFCATCGSPRG